MQNLCWLEHIVSIDLSLSSSMQKNRVLQTGHMLHPKPNEQDNCMISNNNDHKCCTEYTKEVFFSFWSVVDFALRKFMKRDAHTIEAPHVKSASTFDKQKWPQG